MFLDSIALLRNSKEFDKFMSFIERYVRFNEYIWFSSNHRLFLKSAKKIKYNNYMRRKIANFCNSKEELFISFIKSGDFYANEEIIDEFKYYLISIKEEINEKIFSRALEVLSKQRYAHPINFVSVAIATKLKISSIF
jgi:hypothetical protein